MSGCGLISFGLFPVTCRAASSINLGMGIDGHGPLVTGFNCCLAQSPFSSYKPSGIYLYIPAQDVMRNIACLLMVHLIWHFFSQWPSFGEIPQELLSWQPSGLVLSWVFFLFLSFFEFYILSYYLPRLPFSGFSPPPDPLQMKEKLPPPPTALFCWSPHGFFWSNFFCCCFEQREESQKLAVQRALTKQGLTCAQKNKGFIYHRRTPWKRTSCPRSTYDHVSGWRWVRVVTFRHFTKLYLVCLLLLLNKLFFYMNKIIAGWSAKRWGRDIPNSWLDHGENPCGGQESEIT